MATYKLIWEIELDADSAREAAERALDIMATDGHSATVFTVTNRDTGVTNDVDVMVDDGEGDF